MHVSSYCSVRVLDIIDLVVYSFPYASASTHDRYFLENVAQWILELDRGQGIPFEGKNSRCKLKHMYIIHFITDLYLLRQLLTMARSKGQAS